MMFGAYHKDLMITWENLKPWNILMILKQPWFRSNWISAVRKAFELEYGPEWYKNAPEEKLKQATSPSISYANFIAYMNWWYSWWVPTVDILGIAHLSWWSFKWKVLEDLLMQKWLSAKFDNLFPIPKIVQESALWSQKWVSPTSSLEELYSTWCCGQWMVLALNSKKDAQWIKKMAKAYWIEKGSQGIFWWSYGSLYHIW